MRNAFSSKPNIPSRPCPWFFQAPFANHKDLSWLVQTEEKGHLFSHSFPESILPQEDFYWQERHIPEETCQCWRSGVLACKKLLLTPREACSPSSQVVPSLSLSCPFFFMQHVSFSSQPVLFFSWKNDVRQVSLVQWIRYTRGFELGNVLTVVRASPSLMRYPLNADTYTQVWASLRK